MTQACRRQKIYNLALEEVEKGAQNEPFLWAWEAVLLEYVAFSAILCAYYIQPELSGCLMPTGAKTSFRAAQMEEVEQHVH